MARDDIRAAIRVIDFNSDKADAELCPVRRRFGWSSGRLFVPLV